MFKRALSCLTVLALFVASAVFARADDSVKFDELKACRKVFAYSGSSSAYFYGFYDKTVCSARVVPNASVKWAAVPGAVLAVCHDEENLCALYKTGYESYGAAVLNVNSGRLTCRDIVSGKSVMFSSVAYADGEVFFIIVENGVSYVTGFAENSTYTYRLDSDVRQLFVNDSRAYALTNDRRVYRLSKGGKSYCCQIPDDGKVTDGGCGYVYTQGLTLVSLSGGAEYVGSKLALKLNGSTVKSDSDMLIAAAGGRYAALKKDCSCEIKDIAEKPEDSGSAQYGTLADIIICAQGMTVKELKDKYPGIVLRGKDNSELSSGKLRTGDWAVLNGKTGEIAVSGDIDGTSAVTNKDVRMLMKSMIDSVSLSGCERKAADMNADGAVDNRDLVLLARAAS